MILGDARGVPRAAWGCRLMEEESCPEAACESGSDVSMGNASEVVCIFGVANGACCSSSGTAADAAGWDMICRGSVMYECYTIG